MERKDTAQGHGVGFRGAACEDDFAVGGAQSLGDLVAGALNAFLGCPAVGMIAGVGVAKPRGEVGQHGFEHVRIARRCGGVIEVDEVLNGGQGSSSHGGFFRL